MKIDYKDHYDSAYWLAKKTYQTSEGNTEYYHGPALSWEGFEYIVASLAPLVPGKTLLDIGCGGGDFAARFLKRGFDAYGIDISSYAVENCVSSMKGRVSVADITQCPELDFPVKEFDVVTATDLLEHIYEEDLPKTFSWLVSKSKRWLFFCVATGHDPNHSSSLTNSAKFVLGKGEEVPKAYEQTAISGHVNVRDWRYWAKIFLEHKLTIRWDLMYLFQMYREFNSEWQKTYGWNMTTTWILEKKWT